jgi:hypothetical protein
MDTTTAIVVVIALFVVVAVVSFFLFRGSTKTRITGPWNTKVEIEGSNPVPAPHVPGVRAQDIRSHSGSVRARDETGRGVDAAGIDAHADVDLSSTPSRPQGSDPKE